LVLIAAMIQAESPTDEPRSQQLITEKGNSLCSSSTELSSERPSIFKVLRVQFGQ
jgi:hypothetical protein